LSYNRAHVPVPGTKYTATEARELAALIEADDLRQDGHGRDIVYIGSGETGVLVATLFDYADRLDAEQAELRRRRELDEAAEAGGVHVRYFAAFHGRVRAIEIEMPVRMLSQVSELLARGPQPTPRDGWRVIFDAQSSPTILPSGRVALMLNVFHFVGETT
jgi:hypothetical protein